MTTVYAHGGAEHYKTTLQTASNTIIADEPADNGGQNAGFAPFELLAAALAACTSITIRMYADRKGWPLADVNVEVGLEQSTGTAFSVKIALKGGLTQEQRQRLLHIAKSCPVHKALSAPVTISTGLTGAEPPAI